jgi:hypothetical protein
MRGYRTVPALKLIKIIELSDYSWKYVENNLISIKAGIKKGEIMPKFPINIDYKLGLIVGHILGDGTLDKRKEYVFFSNSNPELIKEFIDCMKEKFGAEPRIWVQKKKKYEDKSEWLKRIYNLDDIPKGHSVCLYYPKICVLILHGIFGTFAKGKNKQITKQIKNSNLDFKMGLIRAFFDDEGSIRNKDYLMRFHQDRKEILNEIKDMLIEFNINSNKILTYIKRNKKRYYFNITKYENYYKYYILIGCSSSKKKREFELLIKKVGNCKKFKNKNLEKLSAFTNTYPFT